VPTDVLRYTRLPAAGGSVPEGRRKVDRKLAVKLAAAGPSSFSTRSSSIAAAASPGVAQHAVANARAQVQCHELFHLLLLSFPIKLIEIDA
jgi:hypothetical protein